MSNDIVSNRSALKDFLASIATISGDLSNITAPPFVLSEKSTVELPQYWADHQSLFVAQAREEDAERRALSVLKYFLCTLRNQQYAGRREEDGVKKPLNAFLGELFLGSWNDEDLGETRLISEQVSHHPPVTACYLWNDKHGVRAEGFTQQEITFSGNVTIKQKGYAILHLDNYDEDYLIPVPTIKVKGILTGVPYPELTGEYSLISSSGYISHIKFTGKSWIGSGQKNGFQANLYHADSPNDILYTAEGAWNGEFTIKSVTTEEIENIDVTSLPSSTIRVADLDEQDAWESRKAWKDVVAAQQRGDMGGVAKAKSIVEQGQREMRKDEDARNATWSNVFFNQVEQDTVFETLSAHDPASFTLDSKGGIWKVDKDAVQATSRPYHGDVTPANVRISSEDQLENRKDSGVDSDDEVAPSSHRKTSSQEEDTASIKDSMRRNSTEKLPRKGSGSEVELDEVTKEVSAKGVMSSPSQGYTDEQVSAFLRARYSNIAR